MNFLPTQLFGSYTPVTGPGGAIPSGMAGVDWPYILNAVFMLLFLWFFFRLLSGIFRR